MGQTVIKQKTAASVESRRIKLVSRYFPNILAFKKQPKEPLFMLRWSLAHLQIGKSTGVGCHCLLSSSVMSNSLVTPWTVASVIYISQ